ncbi:MAG: hypothetical protein ACLPV8_24570 [Steroidobacteraceae bacterium]
MQPRHFLAAMALLLCAAFAPRGPVRADTVLYDNTGFVQGSQAFVESFDITTPGTLTISFTDVPWLDTLSDLNLFLTTASGLLGASMGSGTESMQVEPGMIYAHWFGDAAGQYAIGVYSLSIVFQPQAVGTVALPGSLICLLSGLTLVFARQWRRLASFMVALAWAWFQRDNGAGESAALA